MSCSIIGRVTDSGGNNVPITHARVSLHSQTPCAEENMMHHVLTDEQGKFEFKDLDEATCYVQASAFGVISKPERRVVHRDKNEWVDLTLSI